MNLGLNTLVGLGGQWSMGAASSWPLAATRGMPGLKRNGWVARVREVHALGIGCSRAHILVALHLSSGPAKLGQRVDRLILSGCDIQRIDVRATLASPDELPRNSTGKIQKQLLREL